MIRRNSGIGGNRRKCVDDMPSFPSLLSHLICFHFWSREPNSETRLVTYNQLNIIYRKGVQQGGQRGLSGLPSRSNRVLIRVFSKIKSSSL
jgi:hypothetical protein